MGASKVQPRPNQVIYAMKFKLHQTGIEIQKEKEKKKLHIKYEQLKVLYFSMKQLQITCKF